MNPSSCDDIRAAGWVLKSHFDYRLPGPRQVLWSFCRPNIADPTKPVKAVGATDEEALTKIRLELGLPTNDEEEYRAMAMSQKEDR